MTIGDVALKHLSKLYTLSYSSTPFWQCDSMVNRNVNNKCVFIEKYLHSEWVPVASLPSIPSMMIIFEKLNRHEKKSHSVAAFIHANASFRQSIQIFDGKLHLNCDKIVHRHILKLLSNMRKNHFYFFSSIN